MISSNEIRNRVIDSLMSIDNKEYLFALDKMIESSNIKHSKVPIVEEQKIMLTMSENDIVNGKTINQQLLNEKELEWLSEK